MSFPKSTPEITRWCALLVAMVLSLATAGEVATALDYERTGTAVYRRTVGVMDYEHVTRAGSPEKFRQGVAIAWYSAFAFGVTAFISFSFYRRLSS
jgi:hypothetical protein